MELRLLQTAEEKNAFSNGMAFARANNSGSFREKPSSRLAEVSAICGRLYGIFDDEGDDPRQILAGFTVHRLDEFPQSYAKPDLTHIPVNQIFEGGEHWSVAKGAGLIARHACCLLLGVLEARAFLAYAIVSPWDRSAPYKSFERVGEPFLWPYLETLEGRPIYVQALLLEGEKLREVAGKAMSQGFACFEDNRRIRFPRPLGIKPTLLPGFLPERNSSALTAAATLAG